MEFNSNKPIYKQIIDYSFGFSLSPEAMAHVNSARRQEFFDTTLKDLFKEMKLLNISIDEVVEQFKKQE